MVGSQFSSTQASACARTSSTVGCGMAFSVRPAPTLRPMRAGGWPLVGRDPELAEIERVLDAAASGLVLAGPAGVGKSRLVGEAIERAGARGWTVVHLRATRSAATLPFGAFAPLLAAAPA